jgi:hypothetical protein
MLNLLDQVGPQHCGAYLGCTSCFRMSSQRRYDSIRTPS